MSSPWHHSLFNFHISKNCLGSNHGESTLMAECEHYVGSLRPAQAFIVSHPRSLQHGPVAASSCSQELAFACRLSPRLDIHLEVAGGVRGWDAVYNAPPCLVPTPLEGGGGPVSLRGPLRVRAGRSRGRGGGASMLARRLPTALMARAARRSQRGVSGAKGATSDDFDWVVGGRQPRTAGDAESAGAPI
eukprot:CAMPEP_0114238568 /NCGR_PEP_ID=MMETSP0058-20121206/7993_1 /TAXON_ID=36894 /ORGANISM="Pyramimonas parkeae, CCMP726" /LENGTH=188 /DNA_ID=CAMNT_0001350685 /DNA_START=287 /DNA_END=852 /DNA_ORIENTATION=-